MGSLYVYNRPLTETNPLQCDSNEITAAYHKKAFMIYSNKLRLSLASC